MHIACIEANKRAINLILSVDGRNERLNINLKDNVKSWTPLYYIINSSDNGQPDIAEALIKYGADINVVDKKGISPLHLAAYKGQDDNVEYLLKQKADINKKDILGRIPLTFAIIEGQTNCVQALVDAGSDLSVTDVNGNTLLHYALGGKGNSLLYANMLIDKGIELNAVNNEGNTPLMVLATKNYNENVRLLQRMIKAGAKQEGYVNIYGKTFYSLLGEEAIKNGFAKDEKGLLKGSETEKKASNSQIKNIAMFVIIPLITVLIAKIIL